MTLTKGRKTISIPPDAREQILNSINESNSGCWEWSKGMQGEYGLMRVSGVYLSAHRVSYTVFKGPIGRGMVLDHLCKNKRCCNPDHLEEVTMSENLVRGLTGRIRKPKEDKYDIANLPKVEIAIDPITGFSKNWLKIVTHIKDGSIGRHFVSY